LTHLDPGGARAVVRWVRELSQEDGLTAIIAEHRQEWWHGQVSQTIRLDAGRIREGGSPGQPARQYPAGAIPYAVVPSRLRAEDLRLAFNHRPVLDGVNLSIEPGEILALIGRNGSGKTTLLRCLTGLQRPANGSILLDGTSIVETPVLETAQKIGYVPQPPSSMLFSDTVREEVELTARSRNGLAAPDEEVHRWAAALDLESLWDRHPRDLSAGERQRVSLSADLPSCCWTSRRWGWMAEG
jgi:energy-coupling factor transporter ATP-binding protein EcfA2